MDSQEEDIAWLKSTFHPVPKPALPDDCIEYALYILDSQLDATNQSEIKLRLRDVQKYATDLQRQWLKDYIWQRQSFSLELIKENGLSFLRGRTEYGDSIEDEWVIVWLLRELTKKFPSLWVKVTDSDGEFLLIEASGTLPKWLEPEVAENRVWINDGQLKIIRPANAAKSSKRTDEKLNIEEAHRILGSEPKRIMYSTSMEEEAFYRLKDYPDKISSNMHNAVLSLPRKVAYLLLSKPAYVAPAVEAFYLRDPISLKPLRTTDASEKLILPPEDLIDLSIKFPRVAYAQLKSQDFPVLPMWKSHLPASADATAYEKVLTGMKLTTGFEILLSDSQYQDRPHVREMNFLLDDLESGDASLPTDSELSKLELRADDESWLDIDFNDLQAELDPKTKSSSRRKAPTFSDKGAQENLQRIVKQFEDFLNNDKTGDGSGLFDEGDSDTDDLDDIDSEDLEEDEDKDASFDDDEFSKLMQEMMGMPAEVMKELQAGKIDALKNGEMPQVPKASSSKGKAREVEELSSDEDEEIQQLTRRVGAELQASGALNLDDDEVAASNSARVQRSVIEELDSSDDEDEEGLPGMTEEKAKEMLEILKAQGGAEGPAAGLMAFMAEQYEAQDEKRNDKGKT